MSSFRVRPRFTKIVDGDPATVRSALVNSLRAGGERFEVKNFDGFVCLRMGEHRRRFWTPRLTLGLYREPGERTRIEGIYGPSANVWSIFLYSYLLAGLVAMFSGFFALAQWLADEPRVWGGWIFGGAMCVVFGLYGFAQVGQKLGARETFELHLAFEAAIGGEIAIE